MFFYIHGITVKAKNQVLLYFPSIFSRSVACNFSLVAHFYRKLTKFAISALQYCICHSRRIYKRIFPHHVESVKFHSYNVIYHCFYRFPVFAFSVYFPNHLSFYHISIRIILCHSLALAFGQCRRPPLYTFNFIFCHLIPSLSIHLSNRLTAQAHL